MSDIQYYAWRKVRISQQVIVVRDCLITYFLKYKTRRMDIRKKKYPLNIYLFN